MNRENCHVKGLSLRNDVNRTKAGQEEKLPWQNPDLQEADYEITGAGPSGNIDFGAARS